ncbi:irregular chiasm C-roughest protein-like isoform X2 [Plodia interpunctella]|uniref:irregular chiasm C-roughest protein-like isoform X2 n=1 Tax=Plodia interpunctella TaxID=58824 RepID=UPI002367A1ED|nr:irregular chiasm C-roughest protein-like isoform X2 [Plodia interpunctella]
MNFDTWNLNEEYHIRMKTYGFRGSLQYDEMGKRNDIDRNKSKAKVVKRLFEKAVEVADDDGNMEYNDVKAKVTSRNSNSLFLLLRTARVGVFKWFLVSMTLCCVCAMKEQKFAIEPQDQSAVVGSRVTLPCRVVSKVGQLQWTKDDFGLGTHRHLTGYDRYKMIGSDDEGDYSLDIREVTLEDDALYQCQVSSGPRGEPAIRSRYARLLVLMPPEPPQILQGSILNTVEEMEVDIECVSVGGKPAAEITWVDHDGGVLTQGVTYTVEPMSDGKRFTARSVLHLRLQRHHHNQTLTCQAQNTADRTYRSATIKIQVQYAPKVRVFVKSGVRKGIVKEGDTVVLGCQASANPSNITYKWFVNNEKIIGEDTDVLTITNASRRYNEATVKCEVSNVVGSSANTKNLEVTYGPVFKKKPQDVEGEAGMTATLTCVVDGHPTPKVLWLRYENERVIRVGKSSNLTLTITDKTTGQYWCRASVDNYQDVEAAAMVYMRSPPKIISNGTQYGVEGDSVRVECISFSIPKPDYIIWTFAGGEINTFHNQDYAFLEETLADRLTKSILIIRKSEARHFGNYNCTVANSYGMDSIEISLVANKSLPLVLIISASASILILMLVIMLIVMLCHRKSTKDDVKKPDITDIGKTNVDPFKDSDRSSNISDLKLELRQVEGGCDMDNSNAGSETDLHPTLHLTTNLGLPLAGPVPLPESGCDNELMKQYQRYSGDFNQPINNIHFKTHSQSNGYVPYVDYTRDYAPPQDSLTGSLSRSVDGSVYPGCLSRQTSCGRLAGVIGPDVIPLANTSGVIPCSMDVRYAATYGNPYLRGSGPIPFVQQVSVNPSAKPPPYYSRNPVSATSVPSPSSTSSKPVATPLSAPSSASGAQPQVPKLSPQSSSLYILPPGSRSSTSLQSTQITARGNANQIKNGTHV